MNIVELIEKVGLDNVRVQELTPAITSISTSGRSGRGMNKVTFVTSELSPRDMVVPGDHPIGLVVWIDGARWPK